MSKSIDQSSVLIKMAKKAGHFLLMQRCVVSILLEVLVITEAFGQNEEWF